MGSKTGGTVIRVWVGGMGGMAERCGKKANTTGNNPVKEIKGD